MKIAAYLLAALTMFAVQPGEAFAQSAKKPYVLKGTSYAPVRRGGYSVKKSHTFESRKFNDPALGPRAQGQPFDNGFFFETPTGPFGGYTPYMN